MKNKEILLVILLIISLVGALFLVRQRQELRRGAYYSQGKMILQPAERIEKNVGEDLTVRAYIDSPSGTKVTNAHMVLCWGSQLDLPDNELTSRVKIEDASGLVNDDNLIIKKEYEGKKCVNIVGMASNGATLTDGMKHFATITFKAVSGGEGNIEVSDTLSKMTGDNGESSDHMIELSYENTSYKINGNSNTPTVTPTQGDDNADSGESQLNYKVSFSGVKSTAKCANNWDVKVIVMGNGKNVTLTDTVVRDGEVDGRAVFKGSVVVPNMAQFGSKVAVFIKGPKHLQMKYGVDGQDSLYNKAGGEIALVAGNNDKVFNFSKHPMLAGDVVGNNSTSQDGVINAVDFSHVKTKVLEHKNYDEGTYVLTDLDGNCSMNSRDTDIVRQSLNEKQGQLY